MPKTTNDKNQAKAATKGKSKAHLTADDFTVLLDWIADPENFAIIHGADGKTRIDGKTMTMTDAFKLMADHLFMNSSNKLLQRLSGAQMQSRWRTQMARYRQTREAAHQQTGFGLEEDEVADNMTLKEKLNAVCLEYERMNELFGERPNILPHNQTTLSAQWVMPREHVANVITSPA
eukprot:jgi/Phyca11/16200/fgenesh1_pg.PHYCAscaffold_18_\